MALVGAGTPVTGTTYSVERFAVPLPVVDFAIVVALFFATAVHVKRALRKSPARGKTCGE